MIFERLGKVPNAMSDDSRMDSSSCSLEIWLRTEQFQSACPCIPLYIPIPHPRSVLQAALTTRHIPLCAAQVD
jgi:hypothetical protein